MTSYPFGEYQSIVFFGRHMNSLLTLGNSQDWKIGMEFLVGGNIWSRDFFTSLAYPHHLESEVPSLG